MRGERKHSSSCLCAFCKSKRGEYKGKNHPNYGKSSWSKGLTKETNASVAQQAAKLRGKKKPKGFGKKLSLALKGRVVSEETKEKISKKLALPREDRVCKCGCGEMFRCKIKSTQKFKNRMHYGKWARDNQIDHFDHATVWNKGLTKETDIRVRNNGRNISKSLKGNPKLGGFKSGEANPMFGRKGPLSPTWAGGTSNLPYPFDFNDELKSLIRERDNHICQLCGRTKEEEGKNLSVHHIDYIKENLDPSNLITLCNRCNSKVNHGRSNWQKFFKRKLKLA